ncbi:hypothetical protein [Salinicola avicenniae]|uniref:hypothetical protein n=1 Tax=Salinicola avicenniae TaxID=2916836 RepID=UPI002073E762|nr:MULTISPECIES: hypothetical protein [unclassified Salinicola]
MPRLLFRGLRYLLLLVLSGLFAVSALADADEPPYPTDMPLLRIVDAAGNTRETLTLEALEALPGREVHGSIPDTHNPEASWYGVSLARLMATLPIPPPARLLAVGLDDYSDVIPRQDLERYDPIVAYRRNGHYLAVDAYGPLVLMYPYASHPELHERTYYSRTVWQLSELRLP